MHPNYTIDSIKPPKYWGKPTEETPEHPNYYHRNPVSSAHTIDLTSSPPKLSAQDSAALSPTGAVIHGRYGELALDSSKGIPLEYLALLHPAAEGAAALRTLKQEATSGTILIYGATEPSGLSALQLASADGMAVVGVASGTHSGNPEFVNTVKDFTNEPSTVVPEEFALVKACFRDVVRSTVDGDGGNLAATTSADANTFVTSFQENLLEYGAYFPESQLSPDPEEYTFDGKDKDREHFDVNISAYLEQFPKGAPKMDEVVLKEAFTKEQYAIFKTKFHQKTTSVITGDEEAATTSFNPADIVKSMTESPESISQLPNTSAADYFSYEFSPLADAQNGLEDVPAGGPIVGAIVAVTPELSVAANAVANAKTLRDKAEALQFLTESEKNAFAAFSSVVGLAKEAGKPVVVVGGTFLFWFLNIVFICVCIFLMLVLYCHGCVCLRVCAGTLPELTTVAPNGDDVKEALSAMELEKDGSSRLNYFVQIYRASDFPVYADYAIHRAQEAVSGPRQLVVTK